MNKPEETDRVDVEVGPSAENPTTSVMPSRAKVLYSDTEVVFEVPSEKDHIGKILLSTGIFYEIDLLRAMERLLSPDSLVVDVGANIGNHTLFFAAVCSCKVVAYEPLADTARVLKRNIELNFLDGRAEVRRWALGANNARAKVTKFTEGNVGATQLSIDPEGSIEVRDFDSEWFDGPVSLIKIDAEGMDLDILLGASGLVSRDRPIICYEANEPQTERLLRELMHDWGYACLGTYNATPTYLFAPAREDEEIRRFLQHQAQMSVLQQESFAALKADFLRSVRYTERLMREHLDSKHS